MRIIHNDPIIAEVTGVTLSEVNEYFEVYGLKHRGGKTYAIIGNIQQ